MTLTELITAVYVITKRADLTALTLQQVQAATLKAHQRDYYARDLNESGVQFPTAELIQSFDYKAVFPLWRALKYFRKYDSVFSCAGLELELITPDGVFDSYNKQKTNVMYLAGTTYNIRMNAPQQYFLCGYYANPNITQSGYSSWIATDHPFAIVSEAARQIFKSTGNDEMSAMYDNEVKEQYALIDISNIVANGS